MKEAEYFQKARDDANFRRDKIVELRAHCQTIRMLAGFMGALLLIAILVCGFGEGRWFSGFSGFVPSLILVAWVYTNTKTRLAALLVMDAATETTPTPSRSDQTAAATS